jgi:hypothetical protein
MIKILPAIIAILIPVHAIDCQAGQKEFKEKIKMKTIRMEELTYPAINAAIAMGYTTVVVGVGSTEQHGPHLPTMTDTRIAEEIAKQ